MNGFELTCHDQNADRISVQSNMNPTWAPMRKRFKYSLNKKYEVGVADGELVVMKSRGENSIAIRAFSNVKDANPILILQPARSGQIILTAGKWEHIIMKDGEALTFRTGAPIDPMRGHRTDITV